MEVKKEFPNGDVQVSFSKMTVSGLAKAYRVDRRTFSKWLQPFLTVIGPRIGYYYNSSQVKIIFERLGLPELSLIG